MEVTFHWAVVAYYAYVDIMAIKGALQAHSLRSLSPEQLATNRMIYGSPTYITLWNMLVQQVYFIMCCREHLLSGAPGTEKQRETNQRTRRVIFGSIMFPTTFVVSIVYWFVYWRSPKLIFGDKLAEVYPPWMDHVMHSFIVPIALIELYLSSTRERATDGGKVKGWLTFNAFISVYIATVIIAHLIRGVWPYPFLDPVNNGSPLLFFFYLYAVGGICYYVGHILSHQILGTRHDGRKKKHRH